jgi:peptidoglycan/LPS O-acetylase OafA/YrhL
MTRNLRIIFLIIFTFFSPLVAKADWEPGPPIEAVIAIGIAVFVIVFCILALISLVIKSIVEFFRKDKKTHIWFQTILMSLLIGLLFYAEEQENLLYDVEIKYSYEKRVQIFYFLIFLAMSFGWIIGYWITPKKKNNLEKSISENP